jgi:hypothetical protein
MKDFELDSKEATIIKNALPIDQIVEVLAIQLNRDFYTVKLQSRSKSGVAKIRCNLISDLQGPQHEAYLNAELKQTLRDAINSIN